MVEINICFGDVNKICCCFGLNEVVFEKVVMGCMGFCYVEGICDGD